MNTQKEMEKAIKHASKYMKKEQDRLLKKPKFIDSVRELGKAYRDERQRRQSEPPEEYCPECLSLKRKPNKDCLNHEKIWNGNELSQAIDELARIMVEKIANDIIEVDTTSEGRSAQRHWFLQAQEALRMTCEQYKDALEEEYHVFPSC
jgi:hypothetical protein